MTLLFESLINMYFDVRDDHTRQGLLSMNESSENKLMYNLTNKLYGHITEKVGDIDFGSIPDSKGDITKIDNYNNLLDCIDTIRNLLIEYKQSTKPIDTIKRAIDNLIHRKNKFELSFKLNKELPMLIYSTITMAIVSSVSFMISSCIEFIKSPRSDDFEVIVHKVGLNKTKDNVLFTNLTKFNSICDKGEMDKVLDEVNTRGSKQMLGIDTFAVMNVVAISVIAISIIPMLRELIYFFYYSRVKISDYFEAQANLIQMNIYNLEKNDAVEEDKKKDIIKKQKSISDWFKKISNFFAIQVRNAENETAKNIKEDNLDQLKYDSDTDSILF